MNTTSNALDLPPVQARKLDAVMDAACQEFPRRYRPDGCIAAARILIDVLARLHVRTRPLAVSADIFNGAMVARSAAEGGVLPETTEQYQRWVTESACWWLTLGGGGEPEPGKWPGHVVVVAWESVLIDLTLPQATRPRRAIVLPPVAVRVWPSVLSGDERRVVQVGGEVHYQARPGDTSFMVARDWQLRHRHDDTVRAILRKCAMN